MSMRTPFARVTGMGSAKEGTGHFWYQRLTGLANIPLTLFIVWLLIALKGGDLAAVKDAFSNPLVAGLGIFAFVSMAWHMKLGMQVVIEDYVHHEGLRLLAVVSNIFFSVLVGGLAVIFIISLSFGS